MSVTHYLSIVSFGLIGEAQNSDWYRHVVFRDSVNEKEADFIVHKKSRPGLWADIEDLERGKSLPPYKGYITRYSGVDMVVFENESMEDAFTRQHWKLDIQKSISYREAEKFREEALGYYTNETYPGAMETGWRQINPDARLVRFRYYEGKGKFTWSKWFEIIPDK
jgi:hypothetical protein